MSGLNERIHHYLLRTDLDALSDHTDAISRAIGALMNALGDLTSRLSEDTLYTYTVPMLSDDGSCSLIDEMAPTPYDLTTIIGGRHAANTRRLLQLNQLVEHATQMTGADWLGVYQVRTIPSTGPVLVKLAYRGRPSRAEFPLTPEFALGSTNSSVGLSGKAKIIDNVAAHRLAGGGFYVCDATMQAEMCVPICDHLGNVVGIVDAEAEPQAFFNIERQCAVVALAMVAPVMLA